jgi:hypothetical protein
MTQRVNVCDDLWHGVGPKHQFEWDNDTGGTCTLTAHDGGDFPFQPGPPLSVPPGISKGQLKDKLNKPKYTYDVDCCGKRTAPKNVLLP